MDCFQLQGALPNPQPCQLLLRQDQQLITTEPFRRQLLRIDNHVGGECGARGAQPNSPKQPGATMLGISSRSCISQRPSRCSMARAQAQAAAGRRRCVA